MGRIKPMNRKQKIWAIVLVLLVGLGYFIHNAGSFLVRDDKLDPADFIVVLMGSGPDRMLEAVDLYKAGYSKKIIMVVNHRRGDELLKSRNVSIPSDPDLNKSVGIQLGVPAGSVDILPYGADSTRDEARCIKRYLHAHPELKSIIIVSSRYHTKRAGIIFEQILDTGNNRLKIAVCPSRYDTFDEKDWWKSREDVEQILAEYIKLIMLYTFDQ